MPIKDVQYHSPWSSTPTTQETARTDRSRETEEALKGLGPWRKRNNVHLQDPSLETKAPSGLNQTRSAFILEKYHFSNSNSIEAQQSLTLQRLKACPQDKGKEDRSRREHIYMTIKVVHQWAMLTNLESNIKIQHRAFQILKVAIFWNLIKALIAQDQQISIWIESQVAAKLIAYRKWTISDNKIEIRHLSSTLMSVLYKGRERSRNTLKITHIIEMLDLKKIEMLSQRVKRRPHDFHRMKSWI